MQLIGRPTWAEVDLKKLEKNFQAVRSAISSKTKIMAVVKANAYGHGSIPISKKLEQLNVDYFAVAIVEEAIPLREAGITKPILILGGYWKGEEEFIVKYNLIPTIFRVDMLDGLSRTAKRMKAKVPYHLKIDTGMGRIGISSAETSQFIQAAARLEDLELEGVFTTFSSADEDSKSFTASQLSKFEATVRQIEAAGVRVKIRHAANSAALVNYPESRFDLVRPGTMLYGAVLGRVNPTNVEPILSLKTKIMQLKKVPAHAPLGYGRTAVTHRESVVATIPIGYYDGLFRSLSNRGKVIVRDRFAPIVGTITMDMTLIDVTDVPGVTLDDEVIVIGRSASLSITAKEIAQELKTVPYEIWCNIRNRVPRVYLGKHDPTNKRAD